MSNQNDTHTGLEDENHKKERERVKQIELDREAREKKLAGEAAEKNAETMKRIKNPVPLSAAEAKKKTEERHEGFILGNPRTLWPEGWDALQHSNTKPNLSDIEERAD